MLQVVLAATMLLATPLLLNAQEPERTTTSRLDAALPAAEAAHVQSLIASAGERGLDQPLASFVREMIAKGAGATLVVSATEHRLRALTRADSLLRAARGGEQPTADEVAAGAEAIGRGVEGPEVAALASSAPSGRSLAVPLFVLAELMDRGLPADDAIARVRERLLQRASDAEMRRETGRSASAGPMQRAPRGLTVSSSVRSARARIPGRAPRGKSGRGSG